MSRKLCDVYTCDICGAVAYSEDIKTNIKDGGFTCTRYSERPEGWEVNANKDMCPECARDYKALMDKFIYDKKNKK